MKIFVTGGAGYIGSHTLVRLLRDAHDVCVFDNYSNSSPESLARVKQLTNSDFVQIEGDVRDSRSLEAAISAIRPDAVVHFAGLKAVSQSASEPLTYYEHNVCGSVNLLRAMDAVGCRRIVFSSSATVYGEAQYLPYDESHPLSPTNPYGRTKLVVEELIRDWASSNPAASAVLLRYFNPVGAHPSGRIGEHPQGVPTNLMPFIAQVAVGLRSELAVFGNDYPTRDGSGERDFIHVVDLAEAHRAALDYAVENVGCEAVNVGTGAGVTVKEMIVAFERASGRVVPYRVVSRRPGDVASSVADVTKARDLLRWGATLGLTDMCASSWRWQMNNPRGYAYGSGPFLLS